jgi:hypothetical protein
MGHGYPSRTRLGASPFRRSSAGVEFDALEIRPVLFLFGSIMKNTSIIRKLASRLSSCIVLPICEVVIMILKSNGVAIRARTYSPFVGCAMHHS